jgi:hypothetical protein
MVVKPKFLLMQATLLVFAIVTKAMIAEASIVKALNVQPFLDPARIKAWIIIVARHLLWAVRFIERTKCGPII